MCFLRAQTGDCLIFGSLKSLVACVMRWSMASELSCLYPYNYSSVVHGSVRKKTEGDAESDWRPPPVKNN